MRRESCGGVALPAVILLLLALAGLAHGVLLLARAEWRASSAGLALLKAEVGARAAIRWGLAVDPEGWSDSVPLWGRHPLVHGSLNGDSVRAVAVRLSSEGWLLEGTGRSASGLQARTGRMAWVLDPRTRVSAMDGVLSVGSGMPLLLEGTIDGSDPGRVDPPLEPEQCDPWADVLSTAAGPVPIVAVVPADSTAPALGPMSFDELLLRAPGIREGVGTPAPVEEWGACDANVSWNWGDPDHPRGRCGSRFVLRGAPGDLRVEGGVGQGVLIVGGDLTLAGEVRFHGVVLVRGALHLQDESRIQGLVLARGGARIGPRATLVGSACWALRALDAAREALGPVPLREPGVIEPL